MSMTLSSPAFAAYATIDSRFTCEGEDISPALSWSGVPDDTQSLALIVDDPDPAAPKTPWVHWVLYNLSPELCELAEAIETDKLPQGALEGINDWQQAGYNGPCPSIGRHRYFLRSMPWTVSCQTSISPLAHNWERPCRGMFLARLN